ncbi:MULTISPECIES: 4-hydroxythreonine-4-phosphate dehydrogenase PdxA [unclassified Arcicella]|uniref:4-hydroxythreonine-4-phosphate dehydrogenase PdxA n=1 Tax=unclassified Arcicella TaxID=2644986 RepID=UPI0028651785|nr:MULTISPECIES: 4-hydroxythreonine-4-phosphate dehydrogenase PdxA [unclassified Arcicella]MDR6564594.1 4-hydroxythreonine-4-phosphate dehydrogenase [Arcicella sp. BE51]MDR6814478.1 4-hydroxythreonine-4-phosphate dehydrogenase [Arcicella sp. BE140]MDR6825766.1 4-hydroxythreonine-4-phosphate dehydrogenase [Arcicella sp. BE139]
MEQQKPIIGITLGDYNGIGPEVILKALTSNRILKMCTPVIYGSQRVFTYYRKALDLKDWALHSIPSIDQINPKFTNVITCWDDKQTEVNPGKVTPEAGAAALACLQKATEDLKGGHIHAIVTAPINKNNIQSAEFKFPGHTEYFTEAFEAKDSLMFLVSDVLRVGVVTGHIPLGRVRGAITQEKITQKLNLMFTSLIEDFGIQKPKIAVLGLNPHAGEDGLLGNEEKEVISPVLEQFRKKGSLAFGPFPADGFFGNAQFKQYDAVLAMYHDQGLIPFKYISFENGVNFTAGLSVVRTSPDHGTAYDIAGKNIAKETSMLEAIFTAIDVIRNRKEVVAVSEQVN